MKRTEALVAVLLFVPVALRAQTVERQDVVGTWSGKAEYKNRGRNPFFSPGDTGSIMLALWRDGLWWYTGDSHGGGRWRLTGDTLWLGDDGRYSYGALFLRTNIPQADTVDTLRMPSFPRNDSLFWTTQLDRDSYFMRTAYRVRVTGEHKRRQLTLVRLDRLSDRQSTWHPAKAILEPTDSAIGW